MATSLENQYIDESYQKLTQISGSILSDGTGSVITELDLTSSYALTASFLLGTIESASYAITASHALNAGVWDGQFSGSAGFTGSISLADSSTVGNLGTLVIKGADGFADDSYIQGVGKYQSDNGQTYITISDTSINLFATGSAASEVEFFINNSSAIRATEDGIQFSQEAIFLGNAQGDLIGTASHATQAVSASYVQGSNVDGEVTLAATASFLTGLVESASYAVTSDTATTATTANTASYVLGSNVDGAVANATDAVSSSHALIADSATSATTSNTASYVAGANVDGTVALATTASYALNVDAANVSGSVTNAEFAEYADNTIVYGKNLTAGTIAKGTPLYFTASGVSGNVVGVYPADAAIPSRMPAAGIAGQELTAGAEGRVILDGFINGVDTSAFDSGDTVYVAAGGGYTNTRPTGSTILVQSIGYVEQSALNGSGVIRGSGRANDVPNIAEGYGWFGNSDGVATAQSTASFAKTDKDNVFSGNQTFNDISVNGTGSFAYIQSVTGSAKIIGDAFIVLNADTPTERYAGLKIYDSGSTPATASFFFDGLNNDWAYEYTSSGDALNYGSVLFGPEYGTKGSPVFPTSQSVLVGTGGHHVVASSNIIDAGTEINLLNVPTVSDNNITAVGTITALSGFSGNLTGNVTGDVTGDLTGNADTATTASYILGSNVDGIVADAESAQLALVANAVSGSNVNGAVSLALTANTASYVLGSSVDGTVTSASYAPTNTADDITWTGNQIFSGSVSGDVGALSIASTTASLDLSTGNFFTLTLANAVDTHLDATNIKPGQTITLVVTNNATAAGTLSFAPEFKFAGGTAPTVTATTSAVDILTFVTVDSSNVYGTSLLNFS